MAAMSDRLARAMAFKALQPLDGHRFADLVMTGRRPAAQLAPSTASITRSRKSCEYGFAIPAGLRPAGWLNQNLTDSGIPIRLDPSAGRSKDRPPSS